jgi:hypothetical protein
MYNEEAQEEGAQLMKANGFKMGRVIHPLDESVIANAVVGTEEDGDFWYGDIQPSYDFSVLKTIAVKLNKNLHIYSDTGRALVVNVK